MRRRSRTDADTPAHEHADADKHTDGHTLAHSDRHSNFHADGDSITHPHASNGRTPGFHAGSPFPNTRAGTRSRNHGRGPQRHGRGRDIRA